jgi:transposase InsO family protein
MNALKPVIHSYPFTLSTYGLFNTVSVDLIEKLRVDDYGMTMIVVIIDNFSRFVDLYPISGTSAEAAADALIQFTGRFQTPTRFTTDSGSNFGSTLVEGLMQRLGADHQLTKAYSKEQNGIVERVNREVLGHLKAIIFDKRLQRKWSKYLPIVQRYINTSRHSATGCTPAEIVFPNGAQIDKELLIDDRQVMVSAYIKDMQEAQGKIIALAEARLRQRDQKHMESKQGEEPEFKVGEYVLTEHRHNSLRRGPNSKLLPLLKGPLLVVKKLSESTYTLRDLITMRLKNYHVSKMRPFLYDERTAQPMQVAAADSFDEFIVEEVLDWNGDPRKGKKTMSFKVRWAGYGPEDDTWVTWQDGKNCTAIQTYLFHHPNRRLRAMCKKGFDPESLDDGLDVEHDSDEESDH